MGFHTRHLIKLKSANGLLPKLGHYQPTLYF